MNESALIEELEKFSNIPNQKSTSPPAPFQVYQYLTAARSLVFSNTISLASIQQAHKLLTAHLLTDGKIIKCLNFIEVLIYNFKKIKICIFNIRNSFK